MPRLINVVGVIQRTFELLQPELRIHQAPEGTTQGKSAGNAELGIAEVLNADPGRPAEEDNNQAAKLIVNHVLKQRERGGQATGAIEYQGNAAGRQSLVEEAVVNVSAVTGKKRLPAEKAAADGQYRVEQWHRQGNQRCRHPEGRGRFLAPQRAETAQQEAYEKAARVAQEDRRWIEVVAQAAN